MKREEHTKIIQDILSNHTDQAKVSELLTQLSDDYGTVLTESETFKTTADKLKGDNENLRDTNMRLFLKVGESKPDNKPDNKTEDTTPSFDDLFDEKGNLK